MTAWPAWGSVVPYAGRLAHAGTNQALPPHLCCDGHRGVDGVGDDGQPGAGAEAGHALHQRAHNAWRGALDMGACWHEHVQHGTTKPHSATDGTSPPSLQTHGQTPCTCVDVEQVVARHARLARHACRDDHQVGAVQRVCQRLGAGVRRHAGGRGNVGQVGRHAGGGRHIVQPQLPYAWGAADRRASSIV